MKLTAMAAMLLLFTGSVIADDNAHKWSVGGSLSYSDYETDEGSISDGAAGFKAHAQYRLKTWASLEGAFYISPDFKGDLTPDKAGGETETSFQGITFHGIAYLPSPTEGIDFFLKGGYFNFFDVSSKVVGSSSENTSSADGLALGLGSTIDAGDNLGIRVEFDWYDVSGADLWAIGIGAEYRF